jgi:acyl-CoA synthetase (NDP forming)
MESLYYDLVGVNKVVSIGNKCDVDEADLIDYFQTDETEVIGMYLENVANAAGLWKPPENPVSLF